MNMLDEILAHKREQVAYLKGVCSVEYLQSVTFIRDPHVSFSDALRSVPIALIAEVKHRSPSAGVIREPFEPLKMAKAYEGAGAQAVSVLIDDKYFGGDIRHLAQVRDGCRVPLLYKEFVVDAWQVWQAASLGASAVLLIVAALTDDELSALVGVCNQAGIEPLVEVHNEAELDRALQLDVPCIGVNNRDLQTLEVSLDMSLALAERAAGKTTLISESGIHAPKDIQRLQAAGFQAVLVGEHLLRQEDLAGAVTALMGEAWTSS